MVQEINGKLTNWWSRVPPIVALFLGLLPGVGGYFVMQYRVDSIEKNYVSRDQLAVEVQKALGTSSVQAEQLKELTVAVQDLSDKIDRMYGAWSSYSAHPKGHRQ